MTNATNTSDFINGFIMNTSKKMRYGHYYTLDNEDGIKFLLHHNPKKKLSEYRTRNYGRQSGDGMDRPFLLAIRDPEGNILVCVENADILNLGKHRRSLDQYQFPHYFFSIDEIERVKGLDITNFRHIHTEEVLPKATHCDDEGQLREHVPVSVSLYEIDGARYLTDMRITPAGLTLEEWLRFEDYRTVEREGLKWNMGLQRVPGLPHSVSEARRNMIPNHLLDEPSLMVHGHMVLKRVLASEAEYDQKIYDGLTVPTIDGVMPDSLVDIDNYRASNRQNPNSPGVGEMKKLFSERVMQRITSYREALENFDCNVKAFRTNINKGRRELEGYGLVGVGDIRRKDSKLYVSEFIITDNPVSEWTCDRAIAKLGNAWYQAFPFRRN